MLATISPAYDNYEETISTLRYADQAKKIVNHAVINEDEPGTIIRELRNEIDKLRKELADAKVTNERTFFFTSIRFFFRLKNRLKNSMPKSKRMKN